MDKVPDIEAVILHEFLLTGPPKDWSRAEQCQRLGEWLAIPLPSQGPLRPEYWRKVFEIFGFAERAN